MSCNCNAGKAKSASFDHLTISNANYIKIDTYVPDYYLLRCCDCIFLLNHSVLIQILITLEHGHVL